LVFPVRMIVQATHQIMYSHHTSSHITQLAAIE
jgi:hypothetical protein